jgi:methylthioribulose-1-phosphate dehydratase
MNQTDQLLKAIAFFAAKGWSPATSTNYSIRGDHQITISRSGVDKSQFTAEDLIEISPQGHLSPEAQAKNYKSSAETEIHLFLYEKFPQMNCVLHTHSPLGTLMSQRFYHQKKLSFSQWEIQKGISGYPTHDSTLLLPIVANSQNMVDIIQAVNPVMGAQTYGFLIAGHGLYAWGKDVFEAKRHIETFEFLIELTYWETLHGHSTLTRST